MTKNWQTDNLTNKTVCLTPVCQVIGRDLWCNCVGGGNGEADDQRYRMRTKTSVSAIFGNVSMQLTCADLQSCEMLVDHSKFIHRRWECKCRWMSCELSCSLFQLKQLWKVSHVTSRLTWSMWQLTSTDPLSIDNQDNAVEVNVLTNTKVCSVSNTKS